MNTRHKFGLALAASVLLGLSACGGIFDDDDDDDNNNNQPPVTQEVPPSASASVEGFIEYLMALVATAPDDLEPVDVSMVTPPTSDTTEPVPLP